MDRKFLEGLGLEKDVIDKIMAQHGVDVNGYQTQLGTKDATIKQLRQDVIDRDGKIADLEKVDAAELQRQLDAERDGRRKDKQTWALTAALQEAGCKDVDYLIYKLGETVEYGDDGSLKDKEGLIKTAKETYAAQFMDGEPQSQPGGTGGLGNFKRQHIPDEKTVTKEQYDKMGYTERVQLKRDNPQLYAELSQNEVNGKEV